MAVSQESGRKDSPNIILLLADDLGRDQIGCYGSTYYETPNIDLLCKQGMKFTNAYAACTVCSPTRASLMTGLSPARLHLTDFIPGSSPEGTLLIEPTWQKVLPQEMTTIAERLKRRGYATGHFGKWHLNKDKVYVAGRPGDPGSQGFDEVLTTEKPGAGPESKFPGDWHHTREITEAAIDFISRSRDKPFFCYAAYNAIHSPEMETEDSVHYFERKSSAGHRNSPVQAAMLRRLDSAVGQIVEHLENLQIADQTLVVFFSDNGQRGPKSGDGFRGSKGDLYEGGIRMPMIVRWSTRIRANSVCEVLTISDDFTPTILDIVGEEFLPEDFDGVSLKPQILHMQPNSNRNSLCWHYPHYHSQGLGPQSAIRTGRYKLIQWHEPWMLNKPDACELYDLVLDPRETKNLANEQPALVAKLTQDLEIWKQRVGAQMPTIRNSADSESR